MFAITIVVVIVSLLQGGKSSDEALVLKESSVKVKSWVNKSVLV